MNRGRIKQKLRLSRAVGHFYKWNLGDGSNCVWCWTCRRFPITQRIIPYAEHGAGWCQDCGHLVYATAEDDWHLNGLPFCPQCGGHVT